MASPLFDHVPEAPIDPILGTTQLFNADTDSRKINLGVGAYRTETGKPFVLNVIQEAEKELNSDLAAGKLDKEYSTIDGPANLKKLTQQLVFGADSQAMKDNRIASVQALSGTGALRVVSEFANKHMAVEASEIWVSDPTWGNHISIFEEARLKVHMYPYWDASKRALNIDGMLDALKNKATPGAMVLLHACAHNPTGVDPTQEQWKQISAVMKEKRLVPLMDSAYQGYASGSLEKDAWAIRHFLSEGFEMFMCQSFAKNLGLYGERIGMLHVVCGNETAAKRVLSQLKLVVRPMYSSPPKHGANLVCKVLGDPARFKAWEAELKAMADRILEVRSMLRGGLEAKGTPGTWNHITDQIGMFSYTGIGQKECERLIKEHHVYLLKSGRISLAGLNKTNMQYMVDAIHEVMTAPKSNL